MTDNRQTTRTFQCREALWACFEQMARELECSVDYLLNDAMKQYARQRGYNSMGADSHSPSPTSSALPPSLRPSTPMRAPLPPVPAAPQGMAPHHMSPMAQPGRQAPAPYYGAPAARGPGAPMPPPVQAQPQMVRRPPPAPLPPPPATRQIQAVAQPGYYAPQSAPPQQNYINNQAPPVSAPQGQPGARPTVNIYYMGERFPVTKDRFIIGRGRQSSDLTIKDPNVSRQHAMIEYLNGYYYIVDMGSTNGVEYAGQRIQRRVVGEGDTFRVCDHELRFSYH